MSAIFPSSLPMCFLLVSVTASSRALTPREQSDSSGWDAVLTFDRKVRALVLRWIHITSTFHTMGNVADAQ
jgi:hypothetical protein